MTGKASDAEPVPATQNLPASAVSATSSKAPAVDSSRFGRAEAAESSNSFDSSDDDDHAYDDEGALVSTSSTRQEQIGREKKPPPPPPSSRHGRSLKDGQDDADVPRLGPPRDVNKPLPPSPIRRSIDDDGESPFDRESAGKVPEPEPEPAPPELISPLAAQPSSSSSSHSRKSAPAPPPRRGHSRPETRSQVSAFLSADEQQYGPSKGRGDETPVRTSSDEPASRPDGARQTGHAPAPPPRDDPMPHPGRRAMPRLVVSHHHICPHLQLPHQNTNQ